MKKRYIIIFIIAILIIIAIGFIFKILINDTNDEDIRNRNNLDIISEYNEYALAVDKYYSESNTYAIFINSEYENYKKIFTLENEGFSLERRFIVWNNDNLYILGYNPKAYNLHNGSIQYETDNLLSICNGKLCTFEKVIGIDDKFIYYYAMYVFEKYYGKVTFDLSQVTPITSDEIPLDLKR